MQPIKSRWTRNSQLYQLPGVSPEGRYKFRSVSSVGGMNYLDEYGEYQQVDLTPRETPHPDYDFVIDKADYTLLISLNGSRLIYPDRNNSDKWLKLPAPNLITRRGQLDGNSAQFTSPVSPVEIRWTGNQITFDIELPSDIGLASYSFPYESSGLAYSELIGLFQHLKVFEKLHPENSVPIAISATGTHIDLAWNPAGLTYPLIIDPTVIVSIAAEGDDGDSKNGTSLDTTGFIGMGELSGLYHAFFRFALAIPKSATIDNASLDVQGRNIVGSGNIIADISAELATNPGQITVIAEYTTSVGNLTVASANWTFDVGTLPLNSYSTTGDFAEVVEEIVGQDAWADGNHILLHFRTNAATSGAFANVYNFAVGSRLAKLTVDYTEAVGGTLRQFYQSTRRSGGLYRI